MFHSWWTNWSTLQANRNSGGGFYSYALCGFHATFLQNKNDRFVPLTHRQNDSQSIQRTSAGKNRQFIGSHWRRNDTETTQNTSASSGFTQSDLRNTIAFFHHVMNTIARKWHCAVETPTRIGMIPHCDRRVFALPCGASYLHQQSQTQWSYGWCAVIVVCFTQVSWNWVSVSEESIRSEQLRLTLPNSSFFSNLS